MPEGIDQSWGYADPAKAASAGVKVVSMYLSKDPSKNATAAKVKAYHAVGIGVILNWEQIAGAPMNGASQGGQDADDAVTQAKALIGSVGYAPKNTLVLYFSCDRDINSGQYTSIDGYYKAAGAVVRKQGGWTFKWGVFPMRQFKLGAYGEADLITHLVAEKITDAEWQTLAWSGGRLDPAADFYQTAINKTLGGASVDLDRIIHADQLGAWWPPNHPLNVSLEDDMTAADVWAAPIKGRDGHNYTAEAMLTAAAGNAADAHSTAAAAAKAVGAATALITALGTHVSQLQAAQTAQGAQLKTALAELDAIKSGRLQINPQELTGTVTVAIGGTK